MKPAGLVPPASAGLRARPRRGSRFDTPGPNPTPRQADKGPADHSMELDSFSWSASWKGRSAWPRVSTRGQASPHWRTSGSQAPLAGRSQASGAVESPSAPCCTPPSVLICERSSRKRGRARTRAPACPGSWRRSSSATSPAESSLMVSGGCAAEGVVMSCWSRFPAKDAVSVRPAPRVGCATPRPAWWRGCFHACRCGSGSCRCLGGRGGSWRATRGWQAGRWKWRCE